MGNLTQRPRPAPLGRSRGLPATPTTTPAGPSAAPSTPRPGGVRQLDLQRPAVHVLPIEPLDGFRRILGRRHLHEPEPPGAPRVAIRHDGRRLDCPYSCEQ